jgi:hypothetical protein
LHCEEHEEGEVQVFNSDSGASCLALRGVLAVTAAVALM